MSLILFVCTGNTCRSPMAEGLLRHALGQDSGYQVRSAGVAAAHGAPASPETLALLKASGIDLDHHRSSPVTSDLIRQSALILAMTEYHREILLELFPTAADRIYLLSEFIKDPAVRDIPDPIGLGRQAYVDTRDTIVAAIPGLLAFLRQSIEPSTNNPP